MTKITFYKTEDGIYYGFRETGHSGYENAGKDIVCSAISAMTMVALILTTVYADYETIAAGFLHDVLEDYYEYLDVDEQVQQI